MAQAEIQSSLNAGELSPGLYARVDLDKYASGAALMRNFIVDYRGGTINRPGTKYIATVSEDSRLIPFVPSTTESYVLVFENLSVGAYFEGALVATVSVPYAAADLPLLKYTQSADVLTIVHPSYAPANLIRMDVDAFEYEVLGVGPNVNPPTLVGMRAPHNGPYNFGYLVTAVDADGKEESLPSPPGVKSSEAMNETTNRVIGLTWSAPLGDDSEPQAVSGYNVYKWGPIDAVTLNPATVWGFIGTSQTTTFSDNNIAPDFSKQPPGWGDPFSGGQFEVVTVASPGSGYNGVSGGWPSAIPYVPLDISGDGTDAAGFAVIDHAAGTIIGAYLTNPGKNYTTATITANGQGGTGATFTYRLTDAASLFPCSTAYFQQRRAFAGSDLKPETLVLSQIGLYNNFNTTPVALDTDALVLSIAGEQINTIKAMVPASYGLLLFTTGGSFLLNGGSPYAPLTPASVSVQAQSSVGINDLMPLRVNADVLYVQNKGNRVRNLTFAWQRQAYQGSDISSLAAHLFDGYNTTDWTWAEEPFKIMWAVRDDGRILSCTYVPDQEVFAWSRHDTQGSFTSICSVPENGADAVYVIVQRHVPEGDTDCGVGWVWHLERFAEREACCILDAWFLDDAKALPHLPGGGDVSFVGQPFVGEEVSLCGNCAESLWFTGLDGTLGTYSGPFSALNTTAGGNSAQELGFYQAAAGQDLFGQRRFAGEGRWSFVSWFEYVIPEDYAGGPISFPFSAGCMGTADAPTVPGTPNDAGISLRMIMIDDGAIGISALEANDFTGHDVGEWLDLDQGLQYGFTDKNTLHPLDHSFAESNDFNGPTPIPGGDWALLQGFWTAVADGTYTLAPGKIVCLILYSDSFVQDSSGQYLQLQVTDFNPSPPASAVFADLSVGDMIFTPQCGLVEVTSKESNCLMHGIVRREIPFIPNDPDHTPSMMQADEWSWVTPVGTLGGLDHLEGKEVWALADGNVIGPLEVSGGEVVLSEVATYSSIIVGLQYTSQLKTLYLTVDGLLPGTIQGKRKFTPAATLRVECSRGLTAGIDFDHLTPIPELNTSSIEPFSGDARVVVFSDWTERAEVCIEQTQPLPAGVLGIITEVVAGDTGR